VAAVLRLLHRLRRSRSRVKTLSSQRMTERQGASVQEDDRRADDDNNDTERPRTRLGGDAITKVVAKRLGGRYTELDSSSWLARRHRRRHSLSQQQPLQTL